MIKGYLGRNFQIIELTILLSSVICTPFIAYMMYEPDCTGDIEACFPNLELVVNKGDEFVVNITSFNLDYMIEGDTSTFLLEPSIFLLRDDSIAFHSHIDKPNVMEHAMLLFQGNSTNSLSFTFTVLNTTKRIKYVGHS
ncbi:MAG: hypothetical protein ACXAD7_27180, partial [Candidatus Kariarchaeaceae archaeon]